MKRSLNERAIVTTPHETAGAIETRFKRPTPPCPDVLALVEIQATPGMWVSGWSIRVGPQGQPVVAPAAPPLQEVVHDRSPKLLFDDISTLRVLCDHVMSAYGAWVQVEGARERAQQIAGEELRAKLARAHRGRRTVGAGAFTTPTGQITTGRLEPARLGSSFPPSVGRA
ncbi:MAG: hypothetical protein HY815_21600 [Candidatus Riflebacteria bacterium]|nr:hypothetical protein [Candidatus Riflebacteria bacterium]